MSPPSRQYLFCPLSFYLVLGEWTREAHRIHLGFFADKDRWLGLCSRRVRCGEKDQSLLDFFFFFSFSLCNLFVGGFEELDDNMLVF